MGGSSSSSSYYFSIVVFSLTFLFFDSCEFSFLLDRTPCEDCTIWPLRVSTDCGQYFAAFEYVGPIHVENFPFFITLSHVAFTGNQAAACMYITRDSKLGRSYALCAAGVIRFVVLSMFSCPICLRGKRHIFGRFFSLHPVKIFLPSD